MRDHIVLLVLMLFKSEVAAGTAVGKGRRTVIATQAVAVIHYQPLAQGEDQEHEPFPCRAFLCRHSRVEHPAPTELPR
jgi:hypothetical protein